MTEAEWITSTEPQKMVEFLGRKFSDRKFQLFCCACCLGNEIAQDDEEPHLAAYLETQDWVDEPHRPLPTFWLEWWPHKPFDWAKSCSKDDDPDDLPLPAKAGILRCIFGPLAFRVFTLDPRWLTPTVKHLAAAIYAERAFDRLPLLADALEGSGLRGPRVAPTLPPAATTCSRLLGCGPSSG